MSLGLYLLIEVFVEVLKYYWLMILIRRFWRGHCILL